MQKEERQKKMIDWSDVLPTVYPVPELVAAWGYTRERAELEQLLSVHKLDRDKVYHGDIEHRPAEAASALEGVRALLVRVCKELTGQEMHHRIATQCAAEALGLAESGQLWQDVYIRELTIGVKGGEMVSMASPPPTDEEAKRMMEEIWGDEEEQEEEQEQEEAQEQEEEDEEPGYPDSRPVYDESRVSKPAAAERDSWAARVYLQIAAGLMMRCGLTLQQALKALDADEDALADWRAARERARSMLSTSTPSDWEELPLEYYEDRLTVTLWARCSCVHSILRNEHRIPVARVFGTCKIEPGQYHRWLAKHYRELF